jgi:Lon protease-like protein
MQPDGASHRPLRDEFGAMPERIPVFPLPNVVLFPRTILPLHIFEPRYRRMVADALNGSPYIGMALLKEGWEEEYGGNPPIYEVGCVGRIASAQRMPDGRYTIVLQGLHRFQIREQYYEKSYRQARVTLCPAAFVALPSELRADLFRLVESYEHDDDGEGRVPPALRAQDDEALVNSLSAYLDLTPLERQFLLEADDVVQRARRLADLLRFKLSEQGRVKGSV